MLMSYTGAFIKLVRCVFSVGRYCCWCHVCLGEQKKICDFIEEVKFTCEVNAIHALPQRCVQRKWNVLHNGIGVNAPKCNILIESRLKLLPHTDQEMQQSHNNDNNYPETDSKWNTNDLVIVVVFRVFYVLLFFGWYERCRLPLRLLHAHARRR